MMVLGVWMAINAQQIFKTQWKGIAVGSFLNEEPITKFTVHKEGDWVYLKAHTKNKSQDIIKSCWKGIGFQEVYFSSGEWLKGFQISGPDVSGYVYLKAVGNKGTVKELLRAKWKGVAVQGYTGSLNKWITGFKASKAGDWIYLEVTSATGVGEDKILPDNFSFSFDVKLNKGYPCINYTLPTDTKVQIKVYDILGRCVSILENSVRKAGKYELLWDRKDRWGREIGYGVYFFKMKTEEFNATKKVIILK